MTKAGLSLTAGMTALLLGLGGAAAADSHRTPPTFEEIDTNSDGVISQAEIAALSAARFATLDTNGDGMVTAEELIAAGVDRAAERAADMAAKMLERLDADGDGALSLAEMPDRAERGFDRLDADDDGAVTREEFEAAADHRRGPRHHDHRRGAPGKPGGAGAGSSDSE